MLEKLGMFVKVNKEVVLKAGLALLGIVLGGAVVAVARRNGNGQEIGEVDPTAVWKNEGESAIGNDSTE